MIKFCSRGYDQKQPTSEGIWETDIYTPRHCLKKLKRHNPLSFEQQWSRLVWIVCWKMLTFDRCHTFARVSGSRQIQRQVIEAYLSTHLVWKIRIMVTFNIMHRWWLWVQSLLWRPIVTSSWPRILILVLPRGLGVEVEIESLIKARCKLLESYKKKNVCCLYAIKPRSTRVHIIEFTYWWPREERN